MSIGRRAAEAAIKRAAFRRVQARFPHSANNPPVSRPAAFIVLGRIRLLHGHAFRHERVAADFDSHRRKSAAQEQAQACRLMTVRGRREHFRKFHGSVLEMLRVTLRAAGAWDHGKRRMRRR